VQDSIMMRWKGEKFYFSNSEKEYILGKDYKFSKLAILEIIGLEFNTEFSFYIDNVE